MIAKECFPTKQNKNAANSPRSDSMRHKWCAKLYSDAQSDLHAYASSDQHVLDSKPSRRVLASGDQQIPGTDIGGSLEMGVCMTRDRAGEYPSLWRVRVDASPWADAEDVRSSPKGINPTEHLAHDLAGA